MRRSPIVIAATVFGTAAVLGFHPRHAALPVSAKTHTTTAAGSPGAPASSRPPATAATGTALGDPISIRYGTSQVRATVSNGKIVKLETVQLPNSDAKSVEISTSAEPVLSQSALTRQTAAVDAVSGATYTSESYKASLQSALDKLGFKAPDGTKASTDVSQLQ
jgi:uncharacterized protein with FMN-binding domain